MNNHQIYDIVVVGCGSAGASAAIYGSTAGKSVAVFTGSMPGGLLSKTSTVYNYTGIKFSTGRQLAENFVEHAKEYANVFFYMADEIKYLENEKLFYIKYQDGEVYSKTIILATGAFPKKLGLETELKYENMGVSYCAVCDGFLYKNRDVAVIGGGNSAFEEALFLSNIAKKVYLIHRRKEFRAFAQLQKELEKKVQESKVQIITEAEVKFFNGKEALEEISLNTGDSIKVDAAFVAIGYKPNSEIVKHLVNCDSDGYVQVDKSFKTSHQAIWACGDVIKLNDVERYKQAIVAAAEGCIAALELSKYLDKKH